MTTPKQDDQFTTDFFIRNIGALGTAYQAELERFLNDDTLAEKVRLAMADILSRLIDATGLVQQLTPQQIEKSAAAKTETLKRLGLKQKMWPNKSKRGGIYRLLDDLLSLGNIPEKAKELAAPIKTLSLCRLYHLAMAGKHAAAGNLSELGEQFATIEYIVSAQGGLLSTRVHGLSRSIIAQKGGKKRERNRLETLYKENDRFINDVLSDFVGMTNGKEYRSEAMAVADVLANLDQRKESKDIEVGYKTAKSLLKLAAEKNGLSDEYSARCAELNKRRFTRRK